MIIPAKDKNGNGAKSKKSSFEKLSSAVSLRSENYNTTASFIFVFYLLAAFVTGGATESFGLAFVVFLAGVFNYIIISWFGLVLRGLEQNNHILLKMLKEIKKDKSD
jgi:hypothetical protein